jgi:DNA-binding NtrC family response regulator/tetratricopeptide (TPR) repeat protein
VAASTVERHPLLLQAFAALERGQGAEAAALLAKAARDPRLPRAEAIPVRCALAEAWLQQDDLQRAADALGKQPDELRERLDPTLLSNLWRLHARLATARGEPSRAIALLGRALKHAERAHDSRAIGLAHYELAICYRQVGDAAIVREHLNTAAPALHAAGDRRHLALVHSMSGITYAQEGRFDEAMVAMRQAERLAAMAGADDVVATVCGNQANVSLMQHRYEQALALAERSVWLQQQVGSPHGLAVALASLGQICVRVGNLARAEEALNRALDIPSPTQFRRETRGAVLDTLSQIHLIRGNYRAANDCLRQAREAYGQYGLQTSRWYEWSIRVLEARVALREGRFDAALALGEEISQAAAPPGDSLQAGLVASEAMLAAGRLAEAGDRLVEIGSKLEPANMPGLWGEFLRVRGTLNASLGKVTEAYHDLSQSVSVFELLGERYEAGLSQLALGSLAGGVGAKSRARRHLAEAAAIFEALGATPDLADARDAALDIPTAATGDYVGPQMDGDDAVVRRLVDAASVPDLLGREAASAMLESCDAESVVIYVEQPGLDPRVVSFAGCDAHTARALAGAVSRGASYGDVMMVEPVGRDAAGPRFALVTSNRSISGVLAQRFRTICAVTRQGFDLARARERSSDSGAAAVERSLEPLLPGFVCASPAMNRVVELIQRLQGNDLTLLVTGESGTGKDLVARAIHAGSNRRSGTFLPFNCTTATRELADSQLFGHRRGSFTGAVADQPGVIRSAAGGTLFLDEIGDLPLDVQPKLLRFLEQSEVLPVGETRPAHVDVRVIAATNADLEQRVAEGRFREDLFYRLSVIRIHVPPLRERREEIPHLSTYFLREAAERLGKPDVRLAPETLDLFDAYPWPGNVRQLRNEVHRAVAMASPGGSIDPDHLSPALVSLQTAAPSLRRRPQTLAAAVERLEREMIRAALEESEGNISETARSLGLTRRGLYLKLNRLGLSARA